jgi:type III restriction enzyme
VAESHPRVKAYVKNHNLGLEAPYRYSSETRRYLPDFIVLVDDGHGGDDLLHLIVETKGYRREDAKEKKATMETYWVPGVNKTGSTAAGHSPSSPTPTRSRLTSKPRSNPNSTI